jgi:hypothetical protein
MPFLTFLSYVEKVNIWKWLNQEEVLKITSNAGKKIDYLKIPLKSYC